LILALLGGDRFTVLFFEQMGDSGETGKDDDIFAR
jgi:hypothetical protein